jgi:cobyrinic acid a,c-diamide synthase
VNVLGPRLVVAGTHSGVGKTTVATGLMAAFRARGVRVASAKVGPDYIDPGYHALATGRPARNLDAWMCGAESIPALAGRAGGGADLLVVEGVMGLFDGASDGTPSSTADVARMLDAPVLLVVDASSMSASVAAIVHGYATLDPTVRLGGVILNRIGSPGHETMLREALDPLGIPVLGALHRDDALTWRDRHLGLVPVVEQPAEVAAALDRLAVLVAAACDLDAIERLARGAPETSVEDPVLPARVGSARIAVAAGPAFSFGYPDNLEALDAAGAEIVPFDPQRDAALPAGCDALVAGGGFPEVYAEALAANEPLLADLRARVAGGLVVWAECGGLLWLAASLDGHPMAGVVDAAATMTERLTLGYRTAVTRVPSPLGPAGTPLRGHEFHYSTIDPTGDALDLEGRFGRGEAGFATPRLLASYLHVHLGAAPALAEAFVRAATDQPGIGSPVVG